MSGEARYTERPWPVLRNAVESVLRLHRPFTNYAVLEADVTDALAAIAAVRRRERVAVSFHAFAIHCLARAAAEHPGVLTYRRGRRLVTFEDADVATTVEKRFAGGVRLPAVYTVRRAQEKSLAEINRELRAAVRGDQSHTEEVRLRRRAASMPALLRRLTVWRMGRDPFLLRRYHGTIGLTSVQNPGFHAPVFILPPNICTLTLALGNTTERVALDAEGRPVRRRVLCLGMAGDHLVVDGMPLSRFGHRLIQLLESAAGLDGRFAEGPPEPALEKVR